MRILITTPSLRVPHGGTRILNEWAVRLAKWHDVTLLVNSGPLECNWYQFPRNKVKLTKDKSEITRTDCLIIGSPHSIYFQKYLKPNQKCFIFLQMMEHLFNKDNIKFYNKCIHTYLSSIPLISISEWNIEELRCMGRTGPMHYIGNGVNTKHFPIEENIRKENTVLIEGWECTNATKDINAVAPQVAAQLKEEGYRIIAYSQLPLTRYRDIPDEYYQCPTLEELNDLYRRAKILLKASVCDARSTAPMEAMTKGTVTVRAIDKGDDDLIGGENSFRVKYEHVNGMYIAAKGLLTDDELYRKFQDKCYRHVKLYSWDYWIDQINSIICD